jgi:hypothetical protein
MHSPILRLPILGRCMGLAFGELIFFGTPGLKLRGSPANLTQNLYIQV